MKNIKKMCLLALGAVMTMTTMVTYTASAATTYTNNRASQAVSIAKAQEGKPYVYGATGPNSFDCSGLMYYVYNTRLGNSIDRTSESQYGAKNTAADKNKFVSFSDARSGDLVFFGSESGPHHVGMYLGGDTYVHAPSTGDVVKESSLSSRSDKLYTVRRIEGWIKNSNRWCYLDHNQFVYSSWISDNNKYYYIDNAGYMKVNSWEWVDGKCYHFVSDGVMDSNKWIEDQGKWYYVGNDGAMQKGWITVSGKQYYLYNDGSMAKNTVIDGKTIGSDGAVK